MIYARTGTAICLMSLALLPMSNAVAQEDGDDPIRELVSRLTLDNYKTTLKGLTQFGDRRQGTQRNRDAIDWIEQFLIDVGCQDVERLDYVFDPEPRPPRQRRPQDAREVRGRGGWLIGEGRPGRKDGNEREGARPGRAPLSF